MSELKRTNQKVVHLSKKTSTGSRKPHNFSRLELETILTKHVHNPFKRLFTRGASTPEQYQEARENLIQLSIRELQTGTPDVRSNAALWLAKEHITSAYPLLLKAFKHDRISVQVAAIRAFGIFGDNCNESIFWDNPNGFAEINKTEVIPKLMDMLEHHSPLVRKAAAISLCHFGLYLEAYTQNEFILILIATRKREYNPEAIVAMEKSISELQTSINFQNY